MGLQVAEAGKIDPMHQFEVQPIAHLFDVGGHPVMLTNSAVWMLAAAFCIWLFMLGGMRRELVPGRWQVAVEGFTGFISSMMTQNIGQEGRKYTPYVFSLFMFILFANILGLLPLGLVGVHPFTVTSHFAITGILAVMSFTIVLIVGFWRHGLHFFSLFVPHGTPWWLLWLIPLIELISFMVRPFSLGLRLFVAMTAGHVLMEVFSSFIIQSAGAGPLLGVPIGLTSMAMMIGFSAMELLIAGIQAYVFALLTSLYLNDAVNLH
ncbi:MAG: F0F1 ATP synthase subunit A [Sphingopyxis sp.]